MRLFIAMEVPEEHKRSVEKAIQRLRRNLPDARWTPRQSWHVTMKFLGEVPDEHIGEVVQIAGEAARRTDPVTTTLTEMGAFPRLSKGRVLWVGVDDPDEALTYLAARMEKKFGKAGLRQESRRLHPHLTLARLRTPAPLAEVVEESGPYRFEKAPFEAGELVVFRSHLSPKGATYEALERVPLGKG